MFEMESSESEPGKLFGAVRGQLIAKVQRKPYAAKTHSCVGSRRCFKAFHKLWLPFTLARCELVSFS